MRTAVSPVIAAALWMSGTIVSLSTVAIAARELTGHMTPVDMILYRSLFGLVLLFPFVIGRGFAALKTKRPSAHLLRNVTHFGGQFAWYFAIGFLPLATVFSIEFSTPLWTALLASFLLGEKLDRWRVGAIVLGVVGVLILLRPGSGSVHPAALVMLGGALCFALSHIYTRELARQESPLNVVFYMNVLQFPLAFFLLLGNWAVPEGVQWLWVLLMAITSITAHYCLSRALMLADASIVIPMDFLRLPFIMLVGYLLYQERLDVSVLVGAMVIVIANFLNLHREHRVQDATG